MQFCSARLIQYSILNIRYVCHACDRISKKGMHTLRKMLNCSTWNCHHTEASGTNFKFEHNWWAGLNETWPIQIVHLLKLVNLKKTWPILIIIIVSFPDPTLCEGKGSGDIGSVLLVLRTITWSNMSLYASSHVIPIQVYANNHMIAEIAESRIATTADPFLAQCAWWGAGNETNSNSALKVILWYCF